MALLLFICSGAPRCCDRASTRWNTQSSETVSMGGLQVVVGTRILGTYHRDAKTVLASVYLVLTRILI